MYRIYLKNKGDLSFSILHNPMLADDGLVVANPVLRETLNTHGTLRFSVAPTNPLYDTISSRNSKVKVMSDTNNNKVWFGRVIDVQVGWNKCLDVYCEGELACLNDSIYRPFGFKGRPSVLFTDLIQTYNDSLTGGYEFEVGNVSVTDPNDLIVRSSAYADTVWRTLDAKLFGSSLGGYVIPRYDAETDTHYIDYLALDENDQYAKTSTQIIKFGENLLDFSKYVTAEDVFTVLIPYGAINGEDDPPENGQWDGNRLTIKSVNNGDDWIENQSGITAWGRIVSTNVWDDVTVASNLLTKATAYLAQSIAQAMTVSVNAVDLAFIDVDIEQIQVGEYVRVISKPHDMNILLLCTSKTTYLTQLEESDIVLGAGLKTISDLQGRELANVRDA